MKPATIPAVFGRTQQRRGSVAAGGQLAQSIQFTFGGDEGAIGEVRQRRIRIEAGMFASSRARGDESAARAGDKLAVAPGTERIGKHIPLTADPLASAPHKDERGDTCDDDERRHGGNVDCRVSGHRFGPLRPRSRTQHETEGARRNDHPNSPKKPR